MKPETGRKGLVRGYIVYADRYAGCIGLDIAKRGDHNVNVAYTFWHRHDENPAVVERELNILLHAVSQFADYSGAVMGYEWKDYRR